MAVWMRCSRHRLLGCGRRFLLKRAPWKYARAPKCPHCGSVHVEDHTAERLVKHRREASERCYCTAYPFPHRGGTLRMCERHALAHVEPTDDEIAQWEACMMTPRGRWD